MRGIFPAGLAADYSGTLPGGAIFGTPGLKFEAFIKGLASKFGATGNRQSRDDQALARPQSPQPLLQSPHWVRFAKPHLMVAVNASFFHEFGRAVGNHLSPRPARNPDYRTGIDHRLSWR